MSLWPQTGPPGINKLLGVRARGAEEAGPSSLQWGTWSPCCTGDSVAQPVTMQNYSTALRRSQHFPPAAGTDNLTQMPLSVRGKWLFFLEVHCSLLLAWLVAVGFIGFFAIRSPVPTKPFPRTQKCILAKTKAWLPPTLVTLV